MQYVMHKTASGESFLAVTTPDGELKSASESHPRFDELVAGVLAGDESVYAKFDVAEAVTEAFRKVTERVVFRDGKVLFDGDPIDSGLEGKILDFYKADEDFGPFVAFLERVMNNPEQHSREQLYSWLTRHSLTLTKDGHMIAYKGVRSDFGSTHAGPGIVNGVEQDGNLDNTPGNVLEMARSSVDNNPNVHCSNGLHVANWRYANDWSGPVKVAVILDPRDVVSVPNDSNFEKVRVSRYTVLEQVTQPYDTLVYKTKDELVEEATTEKVDDVQDAVFQVGDRVVKVGHDHYNTVYGPNWNFADKEAAPGRPGVVAKVYDDGDVRVAWDEGCANNSGLNSRLSPQYLAHEDTRPVSVQGLKPASRPTDKNHLKQKRGPGGRFLPKGS